ncbi:MAG: C39 family peptidase, partial [Kiritimatiellia bacterium]
SAADFMLAQTPLGFGYLSQQRDCARSVDKRLTFQGQRVWEALAFFETGAVKRLELSIYNRGDSGALKEPDFQQLGKALGESLTRWAGNTGNPVEETTKDRGSIVRKHTWIKAPCAVQLTRAYVEPHRHGGENLPFRAEFVKITLSRVNTDQQVIKDSTTVNWIPGASTISIKKNVKKSDTGDVWVDGVPMVDQGEKGYCAAASAERLLRYYGRAVDQHQIAQLADTAAKQGTSLDGMIKALESIGQRFTLDLKPVITLDWNRLSHVIEGYNRAAKAAGKPAVVVGQVINVTRVYEEMDAALLRKVMVKQTSELAQFKTQVKVSTSSGVPMLWSCIVGKFPEVPPIKPPGTYGHMRLILGYNEKTGDLLYSDTWGAGHELKRMPLDDAWTATTGLYVLKPR